MTAGAQQALRRIMETFSETTRFALACNTSSKIIEPIQSRCVILRFERIAGEQVRQMVERVAKLENVLCTPAGLDAIVLTADGDMRQALNNLQAVHYGSNAGEGVTPDSVFRICDQPSPQLLCDILTACSEGRLADACVAMGRLLAMGHAVTDIAVSLFRIGKLNLHKATEANQIDQLRQIAICQATLADGCATPLQLYGLLAHLCRPAIPNDAFSLPIH